MNTPKAFLEQINLWFNGLIALPLLATGVGYLEIKKGRIEGLIGTNEYVAASIILVLLVVVVYKTARYRKQIGYIPIELTLKERVFDYFSISKNYYIFMFIITLLTVLNLYVTANLFFAGLYAFELFLLSLHRPSLISVADKLNLKGNVRSNFLKKDIFEI